ncbi:MAG: hypothetical protein OXI34_06160 [Chloroflexota bacterium]|nr:hypothetical protein [Chloroflexota bacterium]MDE2945688.1 hypothetical protein [Chloroflexota bacterium]
MTMARLLLDSRIVASTPNAKLKLGAVQKHSANPLFVEESFAEPPKPWEARLDNVYPNVIYDPEDGLFKCWYKAFIYDGLSNRTAPPQRPHQSYGESEREEGLLYAISSDGIHWEKPALGLIDFEGSTANNLVMRRRSHGLHAGGVLKDAREPDPARRYKFIHRNARARRMATCFSADGLRWSQPVLWGAHDAVGDCHNNAIWSPALERYICITRGWSAGIRTVLRSESEDFINWTEPAEIMRGADAHDQIYSMPICRYGDLTIGLPSIFHKGDESAADWDTVDTELAFSVDSVNWERICPGQPLIPRGAGSYPDGEHDCGCVYAAAPFVHDGAIFIYYGGSNGLHNNWREGSLNLATLAIDRWAGYIPDDPQQTARLETTPLLLRGDGLSVNADIKPGGSIRAMIMDAGGAEVSGFGMADCRAIKQGGARCPLRWRERDPAELAGQTLRLVFEFQKATLYALNAARVPASD